MTATPDMLVASDRAVRRALVTLEHMNSENTQEWDRTMATFAHARYELPDGTVHDGRDDVMAYWLAGRAAVPDQRNELISLEICEGGQVLLHFHLRGTPAGRERGFHHRLWAVFDFDEDDLMINERVYLERPSGEVIASGGLREP
ncbi:MAG: nuclear transport factor 2 family protein [Acidimicrobiales bacterium]